MDRYPRETLPVAPLVVITHGQSESEEDVERARSRTKGALHWTLTLCVVHHYRQQGWDLDRSLSEADAAVQLDEALCTYSIYYTNSKLIIDAHHPMLRRDAQGRYMWRFRGCHVANYALSTPMDQYDRFCILNIILAVEQQVHLLERSLHPINCAIASSQL